MIPMPRPVTPQTNARRFRALLQFYVVRLIIGIVFFVWLVSKAHTDGGGPFWLVLAGLGIIYAGVSIFNGFRLAARYRRSVEQAAEAERQ